MTADSMSHVVDVQFADGIEVVEGCGEVVAWALTELDEADAEVSVRFVDVDEITALNRQYRSIDAATNVLSFECDAMTDAGLRLLGDIVICAPLVCTEADAQRKNSAAHRTHLLVHGLLHLLGYDHVAEAPAQEMESIERKLLAGLGHADPYSPRSLQSDTAGAQPLLRDSGVTS